MDTLNRYEYVTANVFLGKNTVQGQQKTISIPSGKVVAIANVVAGNTENRIINFSILDNNNEVIKAADFRFSEKTNGGEYLKCLRPVDFDGGREYEARYVANDISTTEDLNFQILFVIQKP